MNHIAHVLREPVDDGKVFVPDDVRDAVRTLLRWTGDDPAREGADRHADARGARLARLVPRQS